ncbi:MAG: radical SAM protein [Phycisphaerae bacterium]|nr:radical SAM protein [Phycisphaerae bacterium]
MRLYLINPRNPIVSIGNIRNNRWNHYRIWKPLGLLAIASATPPEWDVKIIDENISDPDYDSMPRPDLVGVTAFTAQACRAYEIAAIFRSRSVPVIMGGIHATMCQQEALGSVDSVVTGEAELIWPKVLADFQNAYLKQVYAGEHVDMKHIPMTKHDLLPYGYFFGSIQTTRGCPLNCSFCSVAAFNGSRYRARPIEDVVQEFKTIREKYVLIVDDNLIGANEKHIIRAKELFRAMIAAGVNKKWIAQATINIADDEELLTLAYKAGCRGVFVGFESPTTEGLAEIGKKFNLAKNRNMKESVRKIKQHGMLVVGSFIIGLDIDRPGIGKSIAQAAISYGIDLLNTMILTPLPGTNLWKKMESESRIAANSFPDDWKYYTLTFPVAHYKQLCRDGVIKEIEHCDKIFYSVRKIVSRLCGNFLQKRSPLVAMMANLSYKRNIRLAQKTYRHFCLSPQNTRLQYQNSNSGNL